MASNRCGTIFTITTWGESHGKAIGVVIDGCPAGLELADSDIQSALALRAPGRNRYTSPRGETDGAVIYSGVFEGVTTGAPISILIPNHDADSSPYEATRHVLKPGHAQFTYLGKYGCFDHRGGGRASARETACRVAAGAVAQKILAYQGIHIAAYVTRIGAIDAHIDSVAVADLKARCYADPIFCPDASASERMRHAIEIAQQAGDSLGGVVAFVATGLPIGFGDPVYEKLEANLAKAMLSLPASKGFEIGTGFDAAGMRGSEHNDLFQSRDTLRSNHAGGILGGISTAMPLLGRVAFKPPSSIAQAQESVDLSGQSATFQLPKGSRHDPCVAIRAVPVVEAMCALVLVDAWLLNRCAKL